MCLEPPGSCVPRAGVLLGAGGRSEGSGQDSDSVRLTGKEQQWLCSLQKWLWGLGVDAGGPEPVYSCGRYDSGSEGAGLMCMLWSEPGGSRADAYGVGGQSSWGLSAWLGHRWGWPSGEEMQEPGERRELSDTRGPGQSRPRRGSPAPGLEPAALRPVLLGAPWTAERWHGGGGHGGRAVGPRPSGWGGSVSPPGRAVARGGPRGHRGWGRAHGGHGGGGSHRPRSRGRQLGRCPRNSRSPRCRQSGEAAQGVRPGLQL